MRDITIAGRKLGYGHPPFIVAEAGLNHNGDLGRAFNMVAEAKRAGCDAIKFATFKADEFCAKDDPLYPEFKKAELPDTAWRTIKRHCDQFGIIFFSTPQNETDLDLLLDAGVPAIKVGSDDLTNFALIHKYAQNGLPMILSSGMADMADIDDALHSSHWDAGVLMCVCTSEYPCPPESANLARIKTLRKVYPNVPIGFSDHTVGPFAATVASALGACYFEKHFTLDHALPGPDHLFSSTPQELGTWAWAIRNARAMMGNGHVEPTEAERANRVKWRRASGQKIRGDDADQVGDLCAKSVFR